MRDLRCKHADHRLTRATNLPVAGLTFPWKSAIFLRSRATDLPDHVSVRLGATGPDIRSQFGKRREK